MLGRTITGRGRRLLDGLPLILLEGSEARSRPKWLCSSITGVTGQGSEANGFV